MSQGYFTTSDLVPGMLLSGPGWMDLAVTVRWKNEKAHVRWLVKEDRTGRWYVTNEFVYGHGSWSVEGTSGFYLLPPAGRG